MTRLRWRRRSAFSVVELVVVAAMAGLLLGLLVPSVYALRSEAARVQQNNNLKHIGLALHNCNDAFKKMPPTVGTFAGKSGSIHFHLLPYLEQNNVWQANATDTVIAGFVDNKDNSAPANGKFQDALPTTNFAANWMVFKSGPQGGIRITAITDGTSNTIGFAERYQVCNGHPTVWSYDQLYYWAPMFAYYHQGKFQVQPRDQECDPSLPQALNKKGLLVLMLDASTRTVSPSISQRTWWYACHPNDGNVLGKDWDN